MPRPAAREVEALLLRAAQSAFAPADHSARQSGIVRLEWSAERDTPNARPRLGFSTRARGPTVRHWRAGVATALHLGPGARGGAKAISIPEVEAARTEMRERGLDEMLLFDAEGRLVEGARSNLLWTDAEANVPSERGTAGTQTRGETPPPLPPLRTPLAELGAVSGLGLEVLCDARLPIRFGICTRQAIARAGELLAVNAVRGVVPITELDGQPIGTGAPGAWARKLAVWFGQAS